MFPLNWNIPFIRKNGSRTTLGAITGDIAGIEEDVDDLTTQTSALWNTIGQNGAKNKIPLTLENLKAANTGGVWDGNVCTVTDVTYTVNTDSNGFVTNIVANGTAAANRNFTANVTLPVGSYIGNGCPANGSDNSYRIAFYNQTAESTQIDTGNGIGLSPNTDSTYLVHMQIRNGYTANNVTFKPMIRLASDTDPTYQPYAMTNRELTEYTSVKDMTFTDFITLKEGFTLTHQVLKKVANGYSLQGVVQGEIIAGRTAVATMTSVLGTVTEENIFGAARILDGTSGYHPATVGLTMKANGELSVYSDIASTTAYVTFSLFIPF